MEGPPFSFPSPTGFPFLGEIGGPSTLTTSTISAPVPSRTTPGRQYPTWTSTSAAYYPTATAPKDKDGDDDLLDRLGDGAKAGTGIAIALGILLIVAVSVWYCCGCCGLRARRRKRREVLRASEVDTQRVVPLDTMNTSTAPLPSGDAPPQYEETLPPRHQHIAGGARRFGEDEEEGVISDGKTPLSEIPFEDVVLDHSPSEGSSRSFSERHHGLGGDTRGHTNS